MPPKKKKFKNGDKHSNYPQKSHAMVMFWRNIAVSLKSGRPGIAADAAYNKVATDLMFQQYESIITKTWVLAASEQSLLKFENEAEEEKTRSPISLAFRPPRCVILILV